MLSSSRFGIEPNIRKIAVLRANALGDFIFALPALVALRSAYPNAEIVLLARDWHQQFLAQRPSPIDRVAVIPKGGIGNEFEVKQDPAELDAFFKAMQQECFDLAIQLHGGGRNSNPFVQQLGAKLTIGLRTPDAAALDRAVPYFYYQSEILRYLEVVALVGAAPVSLEPSVSVTDRDRAESWSIVPETDKPLVVLHPGASDSRRRWEPEKLAAVGEVLATKGAAIVITGTEPEQDLAGAVLAQMNTEARNTCGQLSLHGLTGLLSRASVVVSNDSGPLHSAEAVGTATVGLYWCGNLITAAPATRTLHRPAISWQLNCPVCGLDCTCHACDHSASFISNISVQEVIDSALELLTLQTNSLSL
jgi:ADP-heptose:LPS heptosyltransferase